MEFMKDKGFVLIGMLFVMVLVGVTAVALNRRAGMEANMAANQTQSVQIYLGQSAATENAIWRLMQSPGWRTGPSGEDYIFNGITYNRKVENIGDFIMVSVTGPGGAQAYDNFHTTPGIYVYCRHGKSSYQEGGCRGHHHHRGRQR